MPYRVLCRIIFTLVLSCLTTVVQGQQVDRMEPGSQEAISGFTTDQRFLTPWVSSVPFSASVPSPSKYLGYIAGSPGRLTHTAKVYGYLRALATASPRVHLEKIGTSEEGREILLVAITDEAGIRDLARLKQVTAALADPRRTPPVDAERLISTGRPFYYFNCALHADETGSAEMSMELAYRLAISEDPLIQNIRRNVVVLINPVSEPDGHDKMVDWFNLYLEGKRDYDALPRQSPPYWNTYVYVDINRDAHQKAFAATRAVSDMFFTYHPAVIHDLHEAIPLLLTWNGTGPYNPNLDAIVTSKFLEMSFHEVTTLTGMGMPGVSTWNFGEGFGLHYLDSLAMNHNAIGRGYETFGNATAETVLRKLDKGDRENPGKPEWYRPSPPPTRFKWSMRDNVNYQQTAALAILDWTARHSQQMLRDFYRTSFNSWQKGINQRPYAFVIPAEQDDRARTTALVQRLIEQHIEVGRLTADLSVAEGVFHRGDYVVKLDQPYRNYAVDLLEPQRFPSDAEAIPYDDVSWALPVGFGIKTIRIDDERVKAVKPELLKETKAAGRITGRGPVFLLRDTGQEGLLAARHRLARFDLMVAEKPFQVGGIEYPAGSWIIPGGFGLQDALTAVSQELDLDFASASAVPDVPRHSATVPRLGLWIPWADTDYMGWIRYTLDREKVPYVYLRDEDVRSGRLRDRVDVIVYGPFVHLDLAAQVFGIPAIHGPMPFKGTRDSPHLGKPAASDDITGGPGYVGLESIRRFVEEGGLLLTLGSGSSLVLEGGLMRGVRRAEKVKVFTPGSELRLTFNRVDHPLAYGYRGETSVFRTNLPVYEPPRHWLQMAYCTSCLDGPVNPAPVVASWGGAKEMLVSGGMRGESDLKGRPAILDMPYGAGRVIAYNFSPIHRDMNRSDHRLLWNAILNWQLLAGERKQ